MRRASVLACVLLLVWAAPGAASPVATMVKDIQPGAAGSSPASFVEVGNRVFFVADDGSHGSELWATDGTDAGTAMVKDIQTPDRNADLPGSWPSGLVGVAGRLFFAANDGMDGAELWMSDGSEAGTVMVKDARPGARGSWPDNLVVAGDRLFFPANEGVHGNELWNSDGTPHGTKMVRDIAPRKKGSKPDWLTAVGATVFFSADDGTHGTELWKSDGTTSGTVMVRDIQRPDLDAAYPGSWPANLTVMGGTLYFSADDGSSTGLWRSRGTKASTVIVRRSLDQVIDVQGLGETTFVSVRSFEDGDQLWKSDGTRAGTTLLEDFGNKTCPATTLTPAGSLVYFNAGERKHGQELWESDGTAAGTTIVKDILPGPEPFPSWDEFCQYGPAELTSSGANLFFVVDDGAHGAEIWMTDGTEAGTVLAQDVQLGAASSSPAGLLDTSQGVFFAADDGSHGSELWKIVP